MRRLAGALALAWVCLLAETKPFEQVLKSVPERARSKRNPMANDPNAPAAGRKLFEQHCAECHGAAAEGGSKAPSLAGIEMQQATPGEIFWIVSNGVIRHGMPSWTRLPEPERWQIVTFLRSSAAQSALSNVPEEAREKHSPIAADPDAPSDGRKLFETYCVQCHGAAAKGIGSAPSLVGAWIQNATLGQLFWVISNGAVPQGMPSWSNLSERQRWQIVAFLKSVNTPQSEH